MSTIVNDAQLHAYCEQHTSELDEILTALERETYIKTTQPHMLSGKLQGQWLRFISLMMRPKSVLEIGTFTGYSALCLAAGIEKDGQLHTIDTDEEKESIVRKYIQKADLEAVVTLHIGDAMAIIPTLDLKFDLVFIDADKENYANYFDLVINKVLPGGLIIADNILWKGKVLELPFDKKTAAIDAFNKKVQADTRVENVLLPIRDGLMVMRKI